MGFLDKLFGRKKNEAAEGTQTAPPAATMPTGDQPAESQPSANQPHEHEHGEHDHEH
jgi:hypothetical protein